MGSAGDLPLQSRGFQASPEVLVQELPGDELIFLDMRTESFFTLDATGSKMYRALVGSDDLALAAARLRPELDVDGERLEADLRGLADTLLQRGLIEPRGG
jgi:Coenzyme PQQ synthesis protein D (PqqD)